MCARAVETQVGVSDFRNRALPNRGVGRVLWRAPLQLSTAGTYPLSNADTLLHKPNGSIVGLP